MLATPVDVSRRLLTDTDATAAELMAMEASSAVVAAVGFTEPFSLPPGFGFLVPPGSTESALLAGTFVHQKYEGRVPAGAGCCAASSAERLPKGSSMRLMKRLLCSLFGSWRRFSDLCQSPL